MIGSCYRWKGGPADGAWCAFKHEPDGTRTLVYAKGAKTRKAAVTALRAML